MRMGRAKNGNGAIAAVIVVAILAIGFLGFSPKILQENIETVKMKIEDGLEVISTKSYQICSNVRWSEIKAAGVKVTETSFDGFMQLCQRLALDIGNLRVYADVELRLLWVYSPSSDGTSDSEVYYVQFT
jgi:hypothetical protein